MSEDEDATLMMPSPRLLMEEGGSSEPCLAPAVGVSSMGDTYFEATQTGSLDRARLVEVTGRDSLVEPAASRVVVGEARQEALVTPSATTAPLERRSQPVSPHLGKVLVNRRVLWPLALLGGAIVGLIIALALRGAGSGPESRTVPSTSTEVSEQAIELAAEEAKMPDEGPPSPSEPKNEDLVVPAQARAMSLLKEDEVRSLQKAALLAELGGDCQESARLYGELERGDRSATGERWQVFSRAVGLRCAHVETEAKRAGDGQ